MEQQSQSRDVPAAPSSLWKRWEGRRCSEQHVLLHVAPTRPISSLAGCREQGKLLAWAWNRQSQVAQEVVTSHGTPGVGGDLIHPFPFTYFCLCPWRRRTLVVDAFCRIMPVFPHSFSSSLLLEQQHSSGQALHPSAPRGCIPPAVSQRMPQE